MKKYGGLGLGLGLETQSLGLGLDKKVLFTSLFVSQNSKPKNRVFIQAAKKPVFGFEKKLRVTRFFGFGKNRVGMETIITQVQTHKTGIDRT